MQDTRLYLTRRQNGIYYYGNRTSGSQKIRWQTTKCKLKSQALRFIKENELLEAESKAVTTLQNFMPIFSNRMQGVIRKISIDGYSYAVTQFIDVVGDKLLSEYTLSDVDRFKEARLAKVKPVTLNISLRGLKTVFNKAEKWGIIENNVFRKVQQLKVPSSFPLYMTKEEFKKLYDSVTNQTFKDLILWSVMTGCRVSESLQVKWKDVDLKKRVILISNSDGFTTKSGNERVIPINDTLFQMLQKRTTEKHPCDLVFHRKGFKLERNGIAHTFKKQIRALELNPAFKFHTLRHTFASWGVQNGISIFTMSKLLGHSSVTVTEIYSHASPDLLRESIGKIFL